jgi:hypothetical protein
MNVTDGATGVFSFRLAMKSDNLDLKQIYVQEVTKEIHFKRVRRER